MQPRQHGHPDRDPAERENRRVEGGEPEGEERRGDQHHLADGRPLAEDRGTYLEGDPREDKDRDTDHDQHVAADDDDGHPGRDAPDEGEADEGRREEKLVGDRVEHGAEGAALVEQAREQTVQAVAHPGREEDGERPAGVPADEEDDEERGEKDPQDGDQVGKADRVPHAPLAPASSGGRAAAAHGLLLVNGARERPAGRPPLFR